MKEYYFLFAVALIWIVFAVVQDIRKREVANWLNFSFITIALGYRGFYSIYTSDYKFFLFGLIGFVAFFVFGMLFYYSRVFGGGDARLLMGIGAILPIESFKGLGFEGIGFILSLFLIGAVYSIIYSVFLVYLDRKKFVNEFRIKMKKGKFFLIIGTILGVISLFLLSFQLQAIVLACLLILSPILYVYVISLDKCMNRSKRADELSEGDWILEDIRFGNRTIRKSVHGLSLNDIKLLRKYGKSVVVKEGIPFVPAFLATTIFMVFFYLVLSQSFEKILAFLF